MLAERIDDIWARIGLYGLASLTSILRVYNNEHFLSDVVVSGLFGVGTGLYVVNREKERVSSSDRSHQIYIYPHHNGIGLAFTF